MTTKRNYRHQEQSVGDRVRRMEGRSEDIGREGVVTFVSANSMAGDYLIRVREDSGSEFQCWDRQVKTV